MGKKVRERDPELFDSCRLNNKIFNGELLPCMLSPMLYSNWEVMRKETPLYADNYFVLPDSDKDKPDGLYGSDIIRQFYGSKGYSYIQIEGKGVYRLGKEDPLKIGVPLFDPSVDTIVYVRVRIKITNSYNDDGSKGYVRPQIYVSLGLYQLAKLKPSNFCLVFKRGKSQLLKPVPKVAEVPKVPKVPKN